MKRREFLKRTLGTAVAAVLPGVGVGMCRNSKSVYRIRNITVAWLAVNNPTAAGLPVIRDSWSRSEPDFVCVDIDIMPNPQNDNEAHCRFTYMILEDD